MSQAGQLDRDIDVQSLSAATGLAGIEHFAMPTKNITQLERFVREVLGGVPYCYAGYDDVDRSMGRKPHIFIRVGASLFQCTEEGGPMHPRKDDPSVSPHWAFGIAPERFDSFTALLDDNRIPYQGPVSQPQYAVKSLYFMSPEGHKLEVCAAQIPSGDEVSCPAIAEHQIDWNKLAHDWSSQRAQRKLQNVDCVFGAREQRTDNVHGLTGIHHFTLPAKDGSLMEQFMIDLLDAERWTGEAAHSATGPLRIGQSGFECTPDVGSPLYPVPGDNNISPHWSFGASTAALDHYKSSLRQAGLPVAGPYRHRALDLVSIYFKSPEGHKFEIGTWEPYPPEKAVLMGAPGVGFIPWPAMDHHWTPLP